MRRSIAAWAAACALFGLAVLVLSGRLPPQPDTLALEVSFPPLTPNVSEPLIVTGVTGAGDFLFVRYLDTQTIAFGYDCWGNGGPQSSPIALPAVRPARHSLVVQMPSLTHAPGMAGSTTGNLRVIFDGKDVLQGPVKSHRREAGRLFLGENPLGGTVCGPQFHGQLYRPDGRPVRGAPDDFLEHTDRVRTWLRHGWRELLAFALGGAALGSLWTCLKRTGVSSARQAAENVRRVFRVHRAFAITASICCAVFGAVLSVRSGSFLYQDSFGIFYDFQALSLLQGRLDVPPEAIGREAFVHDGKSYGYFGPTPALIRVPFVLFGVCFGELTRAAMLVYYAGCLLGAYLLLCDARRLTNPAKGQASGGWTVLFTLNVGLGSTLFFLASRAFVYHEAILCGVVFALGGCWFALRHLTAPQGRWWIGALVCGVLSVHARPPTGLFSLTLLGCVSAFIAWREHGHWQRTARHLGIGAACVAGVATFNGLSYLKFRTIEGCPLRLNVQYDAQRLARIDGKQFHFVNIPFTFHTYFSAPNLLIEPRFPWLLLKDNNPKVSFPAAKIDYTDHTLALPYSSSGLFLLAVLGVALAGGRRINRTPIALTWIAAIPMTLAMLTAIAVTQRYTADFSPFLICAAALGCAAADQCGRKARIASSAFLSVATLWAVMLTAAITLHYQGEMVWGVPEGTHERYQHLQRTVDAWFAR